MATPIDKFRPGADVKAALLNQTATSLSVFENGVRSNYWTKDALEEPERVGQRNVLTEALSRVTGRIERRTFDAARNAAEEADFASTISQGLTIATAKKTTRIVAYNPDGTMRSFEDVQRLIADELGIKFQRHENIMKYMTRLFSDHQLASWDDTKLTATILDRDEDVVSRLYGSMPKTKEGLKAAQDMADRIDDGLAIINPKKVRALISQLRESGTPGAQRAAQDLEDRIGKGLQFNANFLNVVDFNTGKIVEGMFKGNAIIGHEGMLEDIITGRQNFRKAITNELGGTVWQPGLAKYKSLITLDVRKGGWGADLDAQSIVSHSAFYPPERVKHFIDSFIERKTAAIMRGEISPEFVDALEKSAAKGDVWSSSILATIKAGRNPNENPLFIRSSIKSMQQELAKTKPDNLYKLNIPIEDGFHAYLSNARREYGGRFRDLESGTAAIDMGKGSFVLSKADIISHFPTFSGSDQDDALVGQLFYQESVRGENRTIENLRAMVYRQPNELGEYGIFKLHPRSDLPPDIAHIAARIRQHEAGVASAERKIYADEGAAPGIVGDALRTVTQEAAQHRRDLVIAEQEMQERLQHIASLPGKLPYQRRYARLDEAGYPIGEELTQHPGVTAMELPTRAKLPAGELTAEDVLDMIHTHVANYNLLPKYVNPNMLADSILSQSLSGPKISRLEISDVVDVATQTADPTSIAEVQRVSRSLAQQAVEAAEGGGGRIDRLLWEQRVGRFLGPEDAELKARAAQLLYEGPFSKIYGTLKSTVERQIPDSQPNILRNAFRPTDTIKDGFFTATERNYGKQISSLFDEQYKTRPLDKAGQEIEEQMADHYARANARLTEILQQTTNERGEATNLTRRSYLAAAQISYNRRQNPNALIPYFTTQANDVSGSALLADALNVSEGESATRLILGRAPHAAATKASNDLFEVAQSSGRVLTKDLARDLWDVKTVRYGTLAFAGAAALGMVQAHSRRNKDHTYEDVMPAADMPDQENSTDQFQAPPRVASGGVTYNIHVSGSHDPNKLEDSISRITGGQVSGTRYQGFKGFR